MEIIAASGSGLGNRPAATFTGSSIFNTTAALSGGGIVAVNSTANTLTGTAVPRNVAVLGGGVYRRGGTMTTTNPRISANLLNNCVSSVPAVPNCTG